MASAMGSICCVVLVKIVRHGAARHVTHTIIALNGEVAENVDGDDVPSAHDFYASLFEYHDA